MSEVMFPSISVVPLCPRLVSGTRQMFFKIPGGETSVLENSNKYYVRVIYVCVCFLIFTAFIFLIFNCVR